MFEPTLPRHKKQPPSSQHHALHLKGFTGYNPPKSSSLVVPAATILQRHEGKQVPIPKRPVPPSSDYAGPPQSPGAMDEPRL